MTPKSRFLAAVAGEDGAKALAKAIDAQPSLGPVLYPRAVVAWLRVADQLNLDVTELPGVPEAAVVMTKSESGWSGRVDIDGAPYEFRDQTLEHAAAALAASLGLATGESEACLSHPTLPRLGKSLDLLVKARTARLLKTSWNVKQRRRYQFEPGASVPKLWPNGDPEPLSNDQVTARREAYARSVGLDPVNKDKSDKPLGAGFPRAVGNRLAHDSVFDAAHETAHALMTPKGKDLREYQDWLTERADKPIMPDYTDADDPYDDDDYEKQLQNYDEGAGHENVASQMEPFIDRRAGVDPHMFQSKFRSQLKGADEGDLPYDDKSGTVPSTPVRTRLVPGPKIPFANQDIRDESHSHVERFDQGAKFTPEGHVQLPTGPNAKINARAAKTLKAEDRPDKRIQLPGQVAKPRGPVAPTAPDPTQNKLPGPSQHQAPRETANPSPTQTLAQPKVQLPGRKLKITKAEAAAVKCSICKRNYFKSDVFVGCFCSGALSKSIKTTRAGEHLVLELDSSWEPEDAAALMVGLKEDSGE